MTKRILAVLFLVSVLPVRAQHPTPTPTPRRTPRPGTSLADVVRRQQQARPDDKKKRRSLGVISNESLKAKDGKKQLSTVDGKVSAPQASTKTEPSEFVLKDNNGKTEPEWREHAAALRRDVAQTRERVEKLEAETKRLENDFYAWSDGNYRDNVIKPSWDRARDDLKNARTELDKAEAALANLEDEARKAGAPPGWIR